MCLYLRRLIYFHFLVWRTIGHSLIQTVKSIHLENAPQREKWTKNKTEKKTVFVVEKYCRAREINGPWTTKTEKWKVWIYAKETENCRFRNIFRVWPIWNWFSGPKKMTRVFCSTFFDCMNMLNKLNSVLKEGIEWNRLLQNFSSEAHNLHGIIFCKWTRKSICEWAKSWIGNGM